MTSTAESSTAAVAASGAAFTPSSSSPLPPPSSSSSSSSSSSMSSSSAPTTLPPPIAPTKSTGDDREYRVVSLSNSLQVLLIHDAETDKASAAMDVGVGHWSDPQQLPGLAHFLEHMLFLGTERFPDEAEYSHFLNAHGGSSNAFTSSENTNYYFDVRHEYLRDLLDRFSQFFISPLFASSATERELQAVHSEHCKNILTDIWRTSQCIKHLAVVSHPYHKFGTGNAQTLRDKPRAEGVDVRAALLDFHRLHYSANRMRLVVLGREPLDVLQAWVEDRFSAIENRALSAPAFDGRPFALSAGSALHRSSVRIVPIKDLRSLTLLFPLPSIDSLYHSKPTYLISHLIGHESAGSILSLLKTLSYANALSAGMYDTSSSFSLFSIGIELTEKGLQHVSHVVELVFAYVRLLHEADTAAWLQVYEEEKAIHAMNFAFKSKETPMSYTSHLAADLHVYAAEEVLTGGRLYWQFDEPRVRQMLRLISQDNMIVQIVSRDFATECEQTEPWYDTRFSIRPWSEDEWSRIEKPQTFSALHLPHKNEFIATDFTLKQPVAAAAASPAPAAEAVNGLHEQQLSDSSSPALPVPSSASPRTAASLIPPVLLSSSGSCELWWKADTTFLKPKANVLLKLCSPLCHLSPTNAVLTSLFCRLLEDQLTEYSYDADIAGLAYSLSPLPTGLSLVFGGYNHKLAVLVEAVLTAMRALTVADDRFLVVKEQLQRSYANFPMDQPYQHCMYHQMLALETAVWQVDDKLAAIATVTAEQVRAFAAGFLAQAAVTLLVHGNMTADEARQLSEMVASRLAFSPLPSFLQPELRAVQLSRGVRYRHSSPVLNPAEENSAVSVSYQVGEDTPRLTATLDLFAQMSKDSVFNSLRTVEQLGYLVWSGAAAHRGVLSFRIIIQSAEKQPALLEQRVEAFLLAFRGEMTLMDDALFDRHRSAVIARKEETCKTLSAESNRHWTEISNGRHRFSKRQQEIALLRSISKGDVAAFYDEFIGIVGKSRAKLTACMVGKGGGAQPRAANGAALDGEVNGEMGEGEDGEDGEDETVEEREEREEGGDVLAVVQDDEAKDEKVVDGKVKEAAANESVAACDVAVSAAADSKAVAVNAIVPLDETPLVEVTDFVAFKRSMPLYPCLV